MLCQDCRVSEQEIVSGEVATITPVSDGAVLSEKEAQLSQIEKMNKDIRSWGIFSLILGLVHLLLSGLLDSSWGIMLILVGLSSFYFRTASLYVVFAVMLVWAGVANLSSGEAAWVVFAFIQFIGAFQAIRQYYRYRKAGFVKNAELQQQGHIQYSRAESVFPWASCLMGTLAGLTVITFFLGIVLYAVIYPEQEQIPYESVMAFLIALAINIGILALGFGLAAGLSNYGWKLLSIIGILCGVVVVAIFLFLVLMGSSPGDSLINA